MPKPFSAVSPTHMIRVTVLKYTDHNIPVPGQVCLLCLALYFFVSFNFWLPC